MKVRFTIEVEVNPIDYMREFQDVQCPERIAKDLGSLALFLLSQNSGQYPNAGIGAYKLVEYDALVR
jgi:hypothetical protein